MFTSTVVAKSMVEQKYSQINHLESALRKKEFFKDFLNLDTESCSRICLLNLFQRKGPA